MLWPSWIVVRTTYSCISVLPRKGYCAISDGIDGRAPVVGHIESAMPGRMPLRDPARAWPKEFAPVGFDVGRCASCFIWPLCPVKVLKGISRNTILADFKVEMGAGGQTSLPDDPDLLSLHQGFSGLDGGSTQVSIEAGMALSVLEQDVDPVAIIIFQNREHDAISDGVDRCAGLTGDVKSRMTGRIALGHPARSWPQESAELPGRAGRGQGHSTRGSSHATRDRRRQVVDLLPGQNRQEDEHRTGNQGNTLERPA